MNGNGPIALSSDTEPFIKKEHKELDIEISNLCKYRNLKEQKCTIPLITKIKEYDFLEAQKYAMDTITMLQDYLQNTHRLCNTCTSVALIHYRLP